MENILPFLLVLIGIGFKIYDNFKKEQEKARNRNISVPVDRGSKPDLERVKPVTKPAPVLVEEEFHPAHPYEPRYRPVYKEPQAPPTPAEATQRPYFQHIEAARGNIKRPAEIPAEEVKKGRAIHKPHGHTFTRHIEVEEIHPYANFDFKDAIIKEAILNRPKH